MASSSQEHLPAGVLGLRFWLFGVCKTLRGDGQAFLQVALGEDSVDMVPLHRGPAGKETHVALGGTLPGLAGLPPKDAAESTLFLHLHPRGVHPLTALTVRLRAAGDAQGRLAQLGSGMITVRELLCRASEAVPGEPLHISIPITRVTRTGGSLVDGFATVCLDPASGITLDDLTGEEAQEGTRGSDAARALALLDGGLMPETLGPAGDAAGLQRGRVITETSVRRWDGVCRVLRALTEDAQWLGNAMRDDLSPGHALASGVWVHSCPQVYCCLRTPAQGLLRKEPAQLSEKELLAQLRAGCWMCGMGSPEEFARRAGALTDEALLRLMRGQPLSQQQRRWVRSELRELARAAVLALQLSVITCSYIDDLFLDGWVSMELRVPPVEGTQEAEARVLNALIECPLLARDRVRSECAALWRLFQRGGGSEHGAARARMATMLSRQVGVDDEAVDGECYEVADCEDWAAVLAKLAARLAQEWGLFRSSEVRAWGALLTMYCAMLANTMALGKNVQSLSALDPDTRALRQGLASRSGGRARRGQVRRSFPEVEALLSRGRGIDPNTLEGHTCCLLWPVALLLAALDERLSELTARRVTHSKLPGDWRRRFEEGVREMYGDICRAGYRILSLEARVLFAESTGPRLPTIADNVFPRPSRLQDAIDRPGPLRQILAALHATAEGRYGADSHFFISEHCLGEEHPCFASAYYLMVTYVTFCAPALQRRGFLMAYLPTHPDDASPPFGDTDPQDVRAGMLAGDYVRHIESHEARLALFAVGTPEQTQLLQGLAGALRCVGPVSGAVARSCAPGAVERARKGWDPRDFPRPGMVHDSLYFFTSTVGGRHRRLADEARAQVARAGEAGAKVHVFEVGRSSAMIAVTF